MVRQALADESVSQILIDIDSPGGSVYGVAELAEDILSACSQKPVIAIANSLAASAAYWIGCSAAELYVTRVVRWVLSACGRRTSITRRRWLPKG